MAFLLAASLCGPRVLAQEAVPAPAIFTEAEFERALEQLQHGLVGLKGGRFTMGCTSDTARCNANELPAQNVRVASFHISATEITQAQWMAVMGNAPSHFQGSGDRPVEMVTWHDAVAFCARLSEKTGHVYRLPTEAEWEYAARGARPSRKHPFAGRYSRKLRVHPDRWYRAIMWYHRNAECGTHPVAGKAPNRMGLFDMNGNVWEWCADRYLEDVGPHSAEDARVVRGGSWTDPLEHCRVSTRGWLTADTCGSNTGFRIVREEGPGRHPGR